MNEPERWLAEGGPLAVEPAGSKSTLDAVALPHERAARALVAREDERRAELARDLASVPAVRRCAVCGWPLAKEQEQGCLPGDCSQRPPPERLYDPERAAAERAALQEPDDEGQEDTGPPRSGALAPMHVSPPNTSNAARHAHCCPADLFEPDGDKDEELIDVPPIIYAEAAAGERAAKLRREAVVAADLRRSLEAERPDLFEGTHPGEPEYERQREELERSDTMPAGPEDDDEDDDDPTRPDPEEMALGDLTDDELHVWDGYVVGFSQPPGMAPVDCEMIGWCADQMLMQRRRRQRHRQNDTQKLLDLAQAFSLRAETRAMTATGDHRAQLLATAADVRRRGSSIAARGGTDQERQDLVRCLGALQRLITLRTVASDG